MAQERAISLEETLDPEDWESMRALGYRMVDDMLDYLRTIRERPVWQHVPNQVKAHFKRPVPLDPQPPEEIYEEFLENVLPYPLGNIHPRFWGWVVGTGTVLGALAELLAASMNTLSSGGGQQSADHVEKQVIDRSLPVNITGHLEAPFSVLPKQSSAEISLKSREIARVESKAPV